MTDHAAALTYYALMAMFPALLVGIALLGLLGQESTVDDVARYLTDHGAPQTTVEAVRSSMQSALHSRASASTAAVDRRPGHRALQRLGRVRRRGPGAQLSPPRDRGPRPRAPQGAPGRVHRAVDRPHGRRPGDGVPGRRGGARGVRPDRPGPDGGRGVDLGALAAGGRRDDGDLLLRLRRRARSPSALPVHLAGRSPGASSSGSRPRSASSSMWTTSAPTTPPTKPSRASSC